MWPLPIHVLPLEMAPQACQEPITKWCNATSQKTGMLWFKFASHGGHELEQLSTVTGERLLLCNRSLTNSGTGEEAGRMKPTTCFCLVQGLKMCVVLHPLPHVLMSWIS